MSNDTQVSRIPATLMLVESANAFSDDVNLEIDARQLACPLPLLKAKQGLRNLAVGDLLRVLTSDSGSLKDFVSFAEITGQLIEGFYQRNDSYCFVIRKQ